MYCDDDRLSVCVCVCLFLTACLHYCTYLDVTWGNGTGCPVVVHCWAALQSVHWFRCYNNIRGKCEMSARTPVLADWLVELSKNWKPRLRFRLTLGIQQGTNAVYYVQNVAESAHKVLSAINLQALVLRFVHT